MDLYIIMDIPGGVSDKIHHIVQDGRCSFNPGLEDPEVRES